MHEKRIPKTIHYVWLGKGEKSDLILKCIASWKKFMPEYEIVEWNEDNLKFDNAYAREAYELKKYAFASDYFRLKVVYEHGGIYLDTDVELIKSLEPILKKGGFIGFERNTTVTTGLGFAAPAGSKVVESMLLAYEHLPFVVDGKVDSKPCPLRNTESLVRLGLRPDNTIQQIGDIIVYPTEYFCPVDYDTGKITITENTISIHHYGYSWADEEAKKILHLKRRVYAVVPRFLAQYVFMVVNKIYQISRRT